MAEALISHSFGGNIKDAIVDEDFDIIVNGSTEIDYGKKDQGVYYLWNYEPNDEDYIVRAGTKVTVGMGNSTIAQEYNITSDKIVEGNTILGVEGSFKQNFKKVKDLTLNGGPSNVTLAEEYESGNWPSSAIYYIYAEYDGMFGTEVSHNIVKISSFTEMTAQCKIAEFSTNVYLNFYYFNDNGSGLRAIGLSSASTISIRASVYEISKMYQNKSDYGSIQELT